jgi:hypothetical protein
MTYYSPAYAPVLPSPLLMPGMLLGTLCVMALVFWIIARVQQKKRGAPLGRELLAKARREHAFALVTLPLVSIASGIWMFATPGNPVAFFACGFTGGFWLKFMFWPEPPKAPVVAPVVVFTAVRVRERISPLVRGIVWRRDGGQCVRCGSTEKLELGHIIPWSLGGSDSEENIQLLCQWHNRSEGNRI